MAGISNGRSRCGIYARRLPAWSIIASGVPVVGDSPEAQVIHVAGRGRNATRLAPAVFAVVAIASCGGGSVSITGGGQGESVSVTLNPTTASVEVGHTQQFLAQITSTGTLSISVVWSVNQVEGGNSTVGKVSTMGLYAAPNSIPSTNPVTVTVTARQGGVSSAASAEATITAAGPGVASHPVTILASRRPSGENDE